MSVSFMSRNYTCKDCGHSGRAHVVIKTTEMVRTYFPVTSRPEELSEEKLYRENLIRDEYGITVERKAVECPCDKCGSTNLQAEQLVRWDNVMNFYPPVS